MKEILADWGLTLPQAVAAIPVILTLAGLIFKLMKTLFKLVDIISSNKYASLPLKDKLDAMGIIYQDGVDDKITIYTHKLKLTEYGLHFRIPTLRIYFDYLYTNNLHSKTVSSYDFLKHYKAFTTDDNDVPKVHISGFIKSFLTLGFFLALSVWGLFIGIKALKDIMNQSPDLVSWFQLVLYSVTELLFILMIITFVSEIMSLCLAIRFAKKLKSFHHLQLAGKYKGL